MCYSSSFYTRRERRYTRREEVKEVKWAKADEIKSMLESGEFIPYDKSFIDMLFFLRNHNGLHTREDKTF